MQRALLYTKHTGKFTFPKYSLLPFQAEADTARDQGLLRSRCHSFRHLRHCEIILPIVFLTFLKYALLLYFYHSKSHNLRTEKLKHLAAQKITMLVLWKEASTLSILHGTANCVKNGTTRKTISSNQCQGLEAMSPIKLLLVKFEDLVLSIFRNENSTLEINVSHFGVLHWQQWQPPASAPAYYMKLK